MIEKTVILHLEDDPLDAELIKLELTSSQQDYQIIHVSNEQQFKNAIKEKKFDLILADYSLPSYNGLEALARARQECPDIPFVFVSGKLGEEYAVESLKAGATDYVLKQKLFRLVPAVQRAIRESYERMSFQKVQVELLESEERYKTLVENIGIGIALISPDFEVLTMNKQMRTWFPNINIFKNNYCYKCLNDPPKEDICHYCPAVKSFKDGQVHEAIIETPRGNDSIENFRIVTSAIKDKSGTVIAVTEMVENITTRIQAEKQLKNFTAHLDEAREKERKIIAREIHDELGQILSALKIDLFMLDPAINTPEDFFDDRKESMLSLIDRAILSVQSLSARLRPDLIEHLGLIPAIEWELEEFKKRSGLQCELHMPDEEIKISNNKALALYRICQEALTNILRHAEAQSVHLKIYKDAGLIFLRIEDDGVGISNEQINHVKSFGLTGMRERILQWNGIFEIEGFKGKGTILKAAIPALDR